MNGIIVKRFRANQDIELRIWIDIRYVNIGGIKRSLNIIYKLWIKVRYSKE